MVYSRPLPRERSTTPMIAGPPGGGSASALSSATNEGDGGRVTVPVELHPVPTDPMITPVKTRNIQVLAADTTPPFSSTLGKDVANQYETRPI